MPIEEPMGLVNGIHHCHRLWSTAEFSITPWTIKRESAAKSHCDTRTASGLESKELPLFSLPILLVLRYPDNLTPLSSSTLSAAMPAFRTRDTHSAARTLEVSTVAPPSLTIISPTPRAFTFPASHNLADSPYSSPSNSPFEPDLRGLALSTSSASTTPTSISSHYDECRTPPPLSAYTRILSAVSTPVSTPIRRKSISFAAPEGRRPKKGDEDYVKRPENAFILFRRKCCEERACASAPSSMASGLFSADSFSLAANAPGKKQRQADLSKTISQQWKALSPEDRSHWKNLAKEKKREHETLHPDYVYRPQRSGAKTRGSASASGSGSGPGPSTTCSTSQRRRNSAPASQQVELVIPTPRQHSRSASAPIPPPYQAVRIPNVYLPASGSGSFSLDSDADASLMPILVRHGVGNGNGGFDYMPSFSGAYDFEASLRSSDFLRSMLPPTISPTSPPSSTSGSGSSSPYTPATSSSPPSTFSSSYASPTLDAAYSTVGDMGLGLESTGGDADGHYASYASAWAASSPWASAPTAGFAEGDFDIWRIPEIGWELGCTAIHAVSGGNEYPAPYYQEFGLGRAEGEDGEQLDMHFGDMGMEMAFDDMMAGRNF
ncbi:hypothetical protein C8F04DRAFT_1399046 [Mycena alexandri]|uniref:HMG box domain-containing protein n=1 Tax=Mycena alexandri TaxID=1745969 RepID=A0AAD6SJT3_9AGAR|nr:hypothetical protein C8F04DRAFT_1399046 [Mycena alexandri]